MANIKLENVTVRYFLEGASPNSNESTIRALDGLSLNIGSGDRVGLIGRNGGGKSTFLSVVAGSLAPNSGGVRVEGEKLALINRTSDLIPGATLQENAVIKGYGFGLKRAELNRFVSRVFEQSGLVRRVNSRLNSLSTGMAGRFNIALNSQIVKPITILDEWVGTLDVSGDGGSNLLNRITDEAEILVLASHNDSLIKQLCNRVVLLEQGAIIYDGPNFTRAFRLLALIKVINEYNAYSSSRLKLFFNHCRVLKLQKRKRLRERKKLKAHLVRVLKSHLSRKFEAELIYQKNLADGANQMLLVNEQELAGPCQQEKTKKVIEVKKAKLHILHIGKTAGYLVRKALKQQQVDEYDLVFHSIQVKLSDIPVGEKIVLFFRHPIERFCRAFFSRRNSGGPFYISKLSNAEKQAFGRFSSANHLAEELSAEMQKSSWAFKALFSIQFMSQGLSYTLGDKSEWLSREKDIFYAGDSKNIFRELQMLSKLLGIDASKYEQQNQFEIEHFSAELSRSLSQTALINLKVFYSEEIDYYNFLCERQHFLSKHVF